MKPEFRIKCWLLPLLFLLVPFVSGLTVVEDKEFIVVTHNGETKRIFLPEELRQSKNYQIRIPRAQFENPMPNVGNQMVHTPRSGDVGSANYQPGELPDRNGKPEKMDVESILFRVKEKYRLGQYDDAMTLLDQAEKYSPKNPAIKTMKGSLFLVRGMRDITRRYWTESLAIDPNQPNLRVQLDDLGGPVNNTDNASNTDKFSDGQ